MTRDELLAAVRRDTPPATVEGLFDDARAGDLGALRMLSKLFERAERSALRERAE